MTIGERIKDSRIKHGFSQVELADKVGISKQTLYKYEHNIVTNIPSDKIEAIAEALGTEPSVLMGWAENLEEFLKNRNNDYEKAEWFVHTDEKVMRLVLAYHDADDITKKHVRKILDIEN